MCPIVNLGHPILVPRSHFWAICTQSSSKHLLWTKTKKTGKLESRGSNWDLQELASRRHHDVEGLDCARSHRERTSTWLFLLCSLTTSPASCSSVHCFQCPRSSQWSEAWPRPGMPCHSCEEKLQDSKWKVHCKGLFVNFKVFSILVSQ